jgi:hypothetical protein
MLARMTLSDHNTSPKSFTGTSNDAEKADKWLASFQTYTKLRALTKSPQVQYFQFLLMEDAALWLRTLSSETGDTDTKWYTVNIFLKLSLTIVVVISWPTNFSSTLTCNTTLLQF